MKVVGVVPLEKIFAVVDSRHLNWDENVVLEMLQDETKVMAVVFQALVQVKSSLKKVVLQMTYSQPRPK